MTGFEPASPDPKAGAVPIEPHGPSWEMSGNTWNILQIYRYLATIVTLRSKKSDKIVVIKYI